MIVVLMVVKMIVLTIAAVQEVEVKETILTSICKRGVAAVIKVKNKVC